MKITSRILLVLLSFGISAHAADETIALKAARLFDGKSSSLLQNGVVIVRGDKIVDAGSNLPLPMGAQVIDLGDATLSPGFMDAHTHLTADYSGNYNERRLQELDLNAFPSRRFTRRCLHARLLKRDSQPCATWAVVLLPAANLSTWHCAIRSTKGRSSVHECWSLRKESAPPVVISILRAGFVIFFSDASQITLMELRMVLMKFERRFGSR